MDVAGILLVAVTVLGVILIAGLLAGQFRRGVVEELRATITTANTEIEIERGRSDRLEREALSLRVEVEGLRKEVATLRSVMIDDRKLARSIASELAEHRENELGEIKEAIGMSTARIAELMETFYKDLKDGQGRS